MKPRTSIGGIAGPLPATRRRQFSLRGLLALLLALPCYAVAHERQCQPCANLGAASPHGSGLRTDAPDRNRPGFAAHGFSPALLAGGTDQIARHDDTDDDDRHERPDQHRHRGGQSDRWENPDRQRRHEDRRRRFEALPQDQRQRLLDARERFLHLPPEDRERLRQRWRELPPEDRRRWRESGHDHD